MLGTVEAWLMNPLTHLERMLCAWLKAFDMRMKDTMSTTCITCHYVTTRITCITCQQHIVHVLHVNNTYYMSLLHVTMSL
jgi:hypothetical protein